MWHIFVANIDCLLAYKLGCPILQWSDKITSATTFSQCRTPVWMENAKKPLKSWCLRVVVDPYWFMLWAALRKYLSLAFQPILTHLMWSGTIRNHLNRWGTCGNPIFDQKNVKIGPWRAKLCKKGHNYWRTLGSCVSSSLWLAKCIQEPSQTLNTNGLWM